MSKPTKESERKEMSNKQMNIISIITPLGILTVIGIVIYGCTALGWVR